MQRNRLFKYVILEIMLVLFVAMWYYILELVFQSNT
jgi:hypothetical protein